MMYFAPPVELHGNTDQQISDIYTYLFKLANQLNLSFEQTTPSAIFAEVNKALEHADSGQETNKTILDNYQQLKALIIKTADYTASYSSGSSWDVLGKVSDMIDASAATLDGEITALDTTLSGLIADNALAIQGQSTAIGLLQNYVNTHGADFFEGYVAQSEFGTYVEAAAADIEANATGITQMYEYAASLGILGNGESDVDITDIETWSQAYIKSGLLYYDNATPKFGVAVGDVKTLVTIDDHEVVNRQNLLATFTSDRLSFWQSGNEVAYLSSGSMYFPSAHISGGSIEIGGSESGGQHVTGPFYVDNVGNLTASSATISGTLTAQSGSRLGNWYVNTAIYNGKTSISDTSHSGIYIGTDGLYLGDAAASETYIKLLPNGTLNANSATITGTLHAGSGSTIADWTVGKTTGTNPVSYIYSGSRSTYSSTASGIYIGTDGISMGSPTSTSSGSVGVQISSSGALTCRGATINGGITATSLTIPANASVSGLDGSYITSGTVGSTQIAGGAITTAKLAASAVTAAKIAAGTITATEIKANTITSAEIKAGTITGTEIAAGTITSNHLSVGSISASKIGTGTLTATGIDVSGVLTVGSYGYLGGFSGSTQTFQTAGVGMYSSAGVVAATSGGAALKTSAGEVFADASGAGMKVNGRTSGLNYGVLLRLLSNSIGFHPDHDAAISLGASDNRWGVIYSNSSTISTSDRQVKHDISYNIDSYEALFDELKPVKYKFDDGTSNRYHTGFISQDVEESLERLGMSTLDFAGFIKSPKHDEEGHQIEGYNYALRYEEFIALAVLKIKKLEARIAALEGA